MEPALILRWELLCAVAIACFSLSGVLILQIPREKRGILFIFPIVLSVAVGRGLAVFGYEDFGVQVIAGPVLVPIVLVYLARRTVPGWLLTVMSYIALIIAIVFADFLLDASTAFR